MRIKIFKKIKNLFGTFMKASSSKKILEDLSEEQKNFGSRIFVLAIGRVLKRAYAELDGKNKENMERVFMSDDDKAKEKFVKEYIPNFSKFFEEEAKKVQEEILAEMVKQSNPKQA